MNNDPCMCTTWEDEGMWLGYLDEYSDYMTQGKTLDELMKNLIDIYEGLTGGHVPSVKYNREPMEPMALLKDEDIIFSLHLLGCVLLRQGGKHDWFENPRTKVYQPVLRFNKINKSLAKYILKKLS